MRKKIIRMVMKSLYEMTHNCEISCSSSSGARGKGLFKGSSSLFIAQDAHFDSAIRRPVFWRVIEKARMIFAERCHADALRLKIFILNQIVDHGHRPRQ